MVTMVAVSSRCCCNSLLLLFLFLYSNPTFKMEMWIWRNSATDSMKSNSFATLSFCNVHTPQKLFIQMTKSPRLCVCAQFFYLCAMAMRSIFFDSSKIIWWIIFTEILSSLFLRRELWSRRRGRAGWGGMVCWTLSMVADARAVVMEVALLLLYAAPGLWCGRFDAWD